MSNYTQQIEPTKALDPETARGIYWRAVANDAGVATDDKVDLADLQAAMEVFNYTKTDLAADVERLRRAYELAQKDCDVDAAVARVNEAHTEHEKLRGGRAAAIQRIEDGIRDASAEHGRCKGELRDVRRRREELDELVAHFHRTDLLDSLLAEVTR